MLCYVKLNTSLITQRMKSGEREREDKPIAKKPDGQYYYEGITFILDAKKKKEVNSQDNWKIIWKII